MYNLGSECDGLQLHRRTTSSSSRSQKTRPRAFNRKSNSGNPIYNRQELAGTSSRSATTNSRLPLHRRSESSPPVDRSGSTRSNSPTRKKILDLTARVLTLQSQPGSSKSTTTPLISNTAAPITRPNPPTRTSSPSTKKVHSPPPPPEPQPTATHLQSQLP